MVKKQEAKMVSKAVVKTSSMLSIYHFDQTKTIHLQKGKAAIDWYSLNEIHAQDESQQRQMQAREYHDIFSESFL